MLRQYRHDNFAASEKGMASGLRGNRPQVESTPALTPRLVGPEPSAA